MKTNLTLLGSVVLFASVGLTACDSATATNEKSSVEVKKAVVEEVKKVAETATAPTTEVVKEAVVAKAEEVKTEVMKAPVAAVETAKAEPVVAPAVKPEATTQAVEEKAAEPEFKEGVHYTEIFPTMQTDAVGGKVEVVELLWLACPHCFALEPTIKEYKKNLPDYIDFKQVPAMLNPRWAADAKTFYIAELLDPKGEKKLVDKLFNAIHVQKRKRMASPTVVKSFIMQQGFTEAEYDSAANSLALTTKLNRARQVSADSQAQSVPSIIINGKYRTSPYQAGNEKKLMQVIEMLTKREFEK